jgi:hypothetical protein
MSAVAISTPKTTPRTSRKPAAKVCPTPPSHSELTPDAIKAAFGNVETLLNEAQWTDEQHDWSGDSERLIRIAHSLADEASIRPPTGADVVCTAFDIAALIRAARLVPGDSESPARKALIDQAAVTLNWLTGSNPARDNCCDPGVPRPARPIKVAAVMPSESTFPIQREAINQASYRIQSALDTLELGIDATGDDELRGIRIIAEDLVHRFGGAADLADLGGPNGIVFDMSCALEVAIVTIQRLNEHNMDHAVLYAVTYLLESAKQLVDHACENWPAAKPGEA